MQDEIIEGQTAALGRLMDRDFGRLLLGFVDRAQRMPQSDRPAVRSDFWDQHERAEWLEALRVTRPSAYAALPKQESGGW